MALVGRVALVAHQAAALGRPVDDECNDEFMNRADPDRRQFLILCLAD